MPDAARIIVNNGRRIGDTIIIQIAKGSHRYTGLKIIRITKRNILFVLSAPESYALSLAIFFISSQ